MAEDCYCSCSMTAGDSYCSCDRSIICVLDLATPRFEIAVRQPPPLEFGKLLSKRSSRAYKSMTAARQTDEVANAAARKRFTATCSTEELHCSPAEADHHWEAPLQVQSSRSEVVLAADPDSHAADGPQAPDYWRATDPQAPDFYTAELQMTDLRLRKYDFCVTDYPQASADFHATDQQTADFFAVITPNDSDDFDAVDLTGDYYHPQRSVDFGGWEERASSDSAAQVRSPENGTRVQGVVDRKEESSLWTRVKKYVSRRLCCQQR